MEKSRKNVFKKFTTYLYKTRGGVSKAVYKLYKKIGEMVRGAFPKSDGI